MGHNSKVQAKGRRTDGEFKQRVQGFEPVRKNYDGYNANSQLHANLASSGFDAPDRPTTASRAKSTFENQPAESYVIPGRETKATKQAMLASNNPLTGESSLKAYNRIVAPSEVRVVDLQLQNLPANSDLIGIKKISGAKHVINVALDEDNMKGICTGTGRIQIRLNQDENLQDIELAFARKGISASEFSLDSRKKPVMTGPPKTFAQEITNTRERKQTFLQTTDNGIFGQRGGY